MRDRQLAQTMLKKGKAQDCSVISHPKGDLQIPLNLTQKFLSCRTQQADSTCMWNLDFSTEKGAKTYKILLMKRGSRETNKWIIS